MRIIAVTNNKGGVGKTHTVFHLAGAYSEQGRRVLVIDVDPQGNLSGLFLEHPTKPSLYDVLVNDVPLAKAIHPTAFEGLFIVPSAKQLQNIDALLQNEADSQIRLADSLKELTAPGGEAFDLVLLDCPPSLGLGTRNALAAADSVVVPIEADKFSVDGLDNLSQAIDTMKRVVNPKLEIAGILISLFNERRSVEKFYEQALRGKNLPIFETKIKDSTKYREAITVRKPITHYKGTTEYAEAFRQLTKELEHAYVRR